MMFRRFGPLNVSYWPNLVGFRGTWNREFSVGLRIGPWYLHLDFNAGRVREKPNAPDWPVPVEVAQ